MEDKIKINSKYQTFCSLCSRGIRSGEECYTFQTTDIKGKTSIGKFLIHLDCSLAKAEGRVTNVEFRKNVKRKPARRGREPGKSTPANLNNNFKDKERLR